MATIRVRTPSKHPQHLWFKVGVALVVLLVFMAIFINYRAGVGRAIFIGELATPYPTEKTINLAEEQFITFAVLPDEKGYTVPVLARSKIDTEYTLNFALRKLDSLMYAFSLCSPPPNQQVCVAQDVIIPDETIQLYLDANDPSPDLNISFRQGKITLTTLHPAAANYHQFYGKINGLPATGWPYTLVAFRYDGQGNFQGDQGVSINDDSTYGYGAKTLKVFGQSGEVIHFNLTNSTGGQINLGITTYQPGNINERNFQFPGTVSPLPPVPATPSVDLQVNGQTGPLNLPAAATVLLSWTTSNAASCSAPWMTSTTTSGTQYVQVTTTTTYTITCTNAGKSASDSVTILIPSVQPPPGQPEPTPIPGGAFDFSLGNDGDKTVVNGSSVTTNISTLLISGIAQNATFNVSNLPAGITASFSPQTCTLPCNTTASITTAASLAPGKYEITINATAGRNATAAGITKTTQFDLRVYAPLEFTLSSAGDKSTTTGTTTNTTITLQLTAGTPQPVFFLSSGFPSGTSASFNPTSCLPPCTTTLSFTPSILAAAGLYNVTVSAKGAGTTKTTVFTLQLMAAPNTCKQDWLCGDWSACVTNLQSRSCTRNDQCDKFIGTNTQIIPATKPETQRLCQAPPAPVVPPTPTPLLCSPGAKQCSGNLLQQCSYDGKTWTTAENCAYGCDLATSTCQSAPPPKKQKPLLTFPPWLLYLVGSLAALAVIILVTVSLLPKKKFAPAKEYIQESRARGYSDQQIRGRLISEGWEAKKIDKLLK